MASPVTEPVSEQAAPCDQRAETKAADGLTSRTWEGHGTRISEVAQALSELREAPRPRRTTRTAVMTLLVVANTDHQAREASRALHVLGSHHPARIVLIRPEPDQAANLDAVLSVYESNDDEHPVAFDEIALRVGGQAANHLDSLIDPFALADLPVVVWCTGIVPPVTDPLLSLASALIVDTRDVDSARDYSSLVSLSRFCATVIDLSWVRLTPWRDLLASLFEPLALRPFLRGVVSARVRGKSGPRHLLAGWLSNQLQLAPEQICREDGRHVEITVEAYHDGEQGTFDVGRLEGRRVVWAGVTTSTGPSHRQLLNLPDDSLAMSVSEALTHLHPDPVWARALAVASALRDRGETSPGGRGDRL